MHGWFNMVCQTAFHGACWWPNMSLSTSLPQTSNFSHLGTHLLQMTEEEICYSWSLISRFERVYHVGFPFYSTVRCCLAVHNGKLLCKVMFQQRQPCSQGGLSDNWALQYSSSFSNLTWSSPFCYVVPRFIKPSSISPSNVSAEAMLLKGQPDW